MTKWTTMIYLAAKWSTLNSFKKFKNSLKQFKTVTLTITVLKSHAKCISLLSYAYSQTMPSD